MYDVLSGSSSPLVSSLSYLVLMLAFAGFMSVHFLRRLSPSTIHESAKWSKPCNATQIRPLPPKRQRLTVI
ncbi:MAG: hypothetical protein ACR5LD_07955 [Symbiopectobacterium sp.]